MGFETGLDKFRKGQKWNDFSDKQKKNVVSTCGKRAIEIVVEDESKKQK